MLSIMDMKATVSCKKKELHTEDKTTKNKQDLYNYFSKVIQDISKQSDHNL